MIRDISPIEKIFIPGNTCVQLALKLKSPKLVDPILEKMSKYVLGFHTKIIDDKLVTERQEIPVFKLPNNFKNLQDACYYMNENHYRPLSDALASVAANKDTIVLNINHIASDGGFMVNLYNALKEDKEFDIPQAMIEEEKTFHDEIEKATYIPPFVTIDPALTRIKPKDKEYLTNDPMMHHFLMKTDAKNLKVYDPKTKKVKGLTDALWAFIILSASAHNGEFTNKGCSTCVDLRRFIKNPSFANCNDFANLSVSCEATKDTTIIEMMKRLRADFNKKLNAGDVFGYVKGLRGGKPLGLSMDGLSLELSNVGRFTLGGPFKDMWINLTLRSYTSPTSTSFLNFSIDGNGRNTIYTKMRYPPQSLSDREARSIALSVQHGITNIDLNTTCGEAIDILTDFQRSITSKFEKVQKVLK